MSRNRDRHMPDVARILKEYDPATFDERQRKALAKVREAGLLDRLTPEPTPKDGDEGATPSAATQAPAADERPVTKRAGLDVARRRRWPATWIVVLACLGFMLAVSLIAVVVLLGRERGTEVATPGETRTVRSVASPGSVMEVATANAVPSATGTAGPLPSTSAAAATAPSTHASATARPKAREKASDPHVEVPEAGAPSAEAHPAPPPSAFLRGPRPEF